MSVSNHLDDAAPKKTVAEFFAGIGLMRLGLEAEGWQVVFSNDIARDKYETYTTHFMDESPHFRLEDIHNLSAEEIPAVALATASFPCNDLSLAGMRKGLGGVHSSAYWGFVNILEQMGERRPPLVLLENVAGFLTSHGGKDFHDALSALNRLGYAVDPMIIDASRFVPQSRVRLFVIGLQTRDSGFHAVSENVSVYESEIRPKALLKFIQDHPEIQWKIREMPPLPAINCKLPDILESLAENDASWWSEERCNYLVSQMSEKHLATVKEMIQKREYSYGAIFRRIRNKKCMAELRVDGLAGCLRTPRGGSGRQIIVRAGYGTIRARLLTPLECARLMGADGYRIQGPINRALFGFGDAVCVPVISWIARHCLNPAFGEWFCCKEDKPRSNEDGQQWFRKRHGELAATSRRVCR